MAFKIRKDIVYGKLTQLGPLEGGSARAIVHCGEQRYGGSEKPVEDTALRVEFRIEVGDAPITLDLHTGDVAISAAHLAKGASASFDGLSFFASGRLEIVQEVELEMID